MEKIKLIARVFRPSRWYRNFFMLFGSFMAIELVGASLEASWRDIVLTFISLCFVASGNYGINEVADAASDGYHPDKRFRAVASGEVGKGPIVAFSLAFYAAGFLMIFYLAKPVIFFAAALFVLFAILYNLPPLRLKDIPYLDFSLEALNSPLRLLIGWYAVTERIIPVSLLLLFWFMGAFLMAAKRFAEIRSIGDSRLAERYRKSFGYYSEEKLSLAMIGAASASMYMFGVFSVKHDIDSVLMLPPVIVLIVWFFWLAYQKDSVIAEPERIFEKKAFCLYSLVLFVLFVVLMHYHAGFLEFLKN